MTQKNTSCKPIHDALRESLEEFRGIFAPTLESFKDDKVKTATAKEKNVKDFLKSYFPSNWDIKKGNIFDNQGNVSKEVDCVICMPEHPPCVTPKRDIILAEGVYAAVEVKPNIKSLSDGGEFNRSLEQAYSVKSLEREIEFFGEKKSIPEGLHKIPYVVFAGEMSDLRSAAEFINSRKNIKSWTPWDLPDIVVGYDTGLIFHIPEVSVSPLRKMLNNVDRKSGECYALFPAGDETLILFLALLYTCNTPKIIISDPILKKYLLPFHTPKGSEIYIPDS